MADSYARDQNGFTALVAAMLEGTLPDLVEVTRRPKSLFSREKRVAEVKLSLADEIFVLTDSGGKPDAQKIKVVRGITIKTEPLGIDRWLEDLDNALVEYAKTHQRASEGIAHFLTTQGL